MAIDLTGTSRSLRHVRQWPRIELDGSLTGVDLSAGRIVNFRNVSRGGFQTLSNVPISVGLERAFRVHATDDAHYEIRGTVVHCQPVADGSRMYAIGWQATPEPPNLAQLAQLIDDMTRVPEPAPDPVSSAAAGGGTGHG